MIGEVIFISGIVLATVACCIAALRLDIKQRKHINKLTERLAINEALTKDLRFELENNIKDIRARHEKVCSRLFSSE